MRWIWVIIGAPAGAMLGAVIGFGVALVVMSLGPAHNDGTDGMREMVVCLPAGALIGLAAGLIWAFQTKIGTG